MGAEQELRVDNGTHMLYFDDLTFACDRDVEAALAWKGHALLLSSDTDCLSLWDRDGLIRLTRVGVYPQDMAIHGDTAVVCGGADGRMYLLALPELQLLAEYPVPGMPERVCMADGRAWVLTLITEPEVHTELLVMSLSDGQYARLRRFAGVPEAISGDRSGLWIAVSEGAVRLPLEELAT